MKSRVLLEVAEGIELLLALFAHIGFDSVQRLRTSLAAQLIGNRAVQFGQRQMSRFGAQGSSAAQAVLLVHVALQRPRRLELAVAVPARDDVVFDVLQDVRFAAG